MPAPNWRIAVAADGTTRVATLHHEDGDVSVRLTTGPVSIVALLALADVTFLFARPAADTQVAA